MTTRRPAGTVVAILIGISAAAAPVRAEPAGRCPPNTYRLTDVMGLDIESLLKVRVVTASKSSETVSDAPGVVSVVTSDELFRFGSVTLREALDRVPGLTGTTASFTDRSMVASRGDQVMSNGGHLLILLNGRPTREILEGGIVSDLLESFPVSVLERIEVVKGPGSVMYGSNAVSGVINLITRSASENGFSLIGAPAAKG
jgi:outer membrane receptor for ferrienterochelin and colicins